jgi:hypothetical protein
VDAVLFRPCEKYMHSILAHTHTLSLSLSFFLPGNSDFVLLQATAARTSPGFAGTAHIFRGPSSGFAPYNIDTVSSSFADNVACLWTICVAYFNVLTVTRHYWSFQCLAGISW